jgi:hypothetical protein
MNSPLLLLSASVLLVAAAQDRVNPSSYSMENGELSSRGLLYRDDLYKGNGDRYQDDAQLSEGLGQLRDGVTSCSDDPVIDCGSGAGYEWVGWRHIDPTITFWFAEHCVFKTVRIFAANRPEAGVRLFKTAIVSLSDDGLTFRNYAMWHATDAQLHNESARYIDIPLNASANFVRIHLIRANDNAWVLISEVRFEGYISPDQSPAVKPK